MHVHVCMYFFGPGVVRLCEAWNVSGPGVAREAWNVRAFHPFTQEAPAPRAEPASPVLPCQPSPRSPSSSSNVPAAAWGPAAFHVRFSCPSACAAEVSLDDDSGSLVYTCGGSALAETRFTSFEMRSLSVSASAGTHSF